MSTTAPVVETVSRRRIIAPAELEKEKTGRTTPDFWEFIETMTEEMWAGDFMLYILREDPKPSAYGGANTLEKCPGYMIMPNGARLRLDSREDIELGIKEKWGGKAFRLILKKGRERLTEGKCMNDAPPKYPDTNGQSYAHPLPNAGAPSSDTIVMKAMDTVASQPQDAINIAMGALRTVSEIITKQATNSLTPPAANPAVGSLDGELDRAFKAAMIKKLMDPPPDPVKSFLEIRQALAAGDGGGSSNANALVEKILSTAVEKLLNPVAPVTGRTTLLDLGREFIPVLGTTVKETMHEYRLSREADARIAELTRGMVPMAPAPPAARVVPSAAVIEMPAHAQPAAANPPAAAPASEAAAPEGTQLTFQQIEAHIAKIIKNAEYPIDEAVDRVLSFLYDTDGRIVGALLNPPSLDPRLKPGKEGLMQLFTYEPALQSCLVNLPRLSEFIDKFLVAAKEAEEMESRLRAAEPGAPSEPPPAPPAN